MEQSSFYTDHDIEQVLKSADLRTTEKNKLACEYTIVNIKELAQNFFALDLLNYIRKIEGNINDKRFALALNIDGNHWVTIAIENTGFNTDIGTRLYSTLISKDELNQKFNPNQKIYPDYEACQDTEVLSLLSQLYTHTKVQFIDSTTGTYLTGSVQETLSAALKSAFVDTYTIEQSTPIRQLEYPLIHCGRIVCDHITHFLSNGKPASLDGKSYDAYISEISTQQSTQQKGITKNEPVATPETPIIQTVENSQNNPNLINHSKNSVVEKTASHSESTTTENLLDENSALISQIDNSKNNASQEQQDKNYVTLKKVIENLSTVSNSINEFSQEAKNQFTTQVSNLIDNGRHYISTSIQTLDLSRQSNLTAIQQAVVKHGPFKIELADDETLKLAKSLQNLELAGFFFKQLQSKKITRSNPIVTTCAQEEQTPQATFNTSLIASN